MRRSLTLLAMLVVPATWSVLAYTQAAPPAADASKPTADAGAVIKLVQQPVVPEQPPTAPSTTPEPQQPQPQQQQQPSTETPSAASAVQSALGQTSFSGAAQGGRSAGDASGAVNVSGGQSQPRAASDVGDLLGKSQESTGVELQRRTPIVSDPRIRGEHVGQVSTWADGGYFFPARQDLDTAASKLDASLLRDVIVIKGPYSVLYGPVFSVLDAATFDTPRYKENGPEYHSRTSAGYQTNGQRLDAMETLWGGGEDWGFRLSYGLRVGNDYRDGLGGIVPSSYNSQPINFALGFNLSCDNRIEFKGLHLDQRNVEFAGLYFDINHLQTDAESVRWTVEHQEYFDKLVLDVWFNRTAADGDTHQGAKQVFLANFLTTSFNPPGALFAPAAITDHSFTNFHEMSRGYRLGVTWGCEDACRLTVGTDINFLNQELAENIRFQATDPATGQPAAFVPFEGSSVGMQDLGIPSAHYVDPGVFAEAVLPVDKHFTVKTGVRGDFAETDSNARAVTGNIPLFFGAPGMAPPPPAPSGSFDPILFSTNPLDNDLHREFLLWSAYISADYKIDEHLTALASFGYAQRPPTLTELYASGPFIAVLQQGLDRLYGDPSLQPERLKQLDVGLRGDYGWYRAGATGFYMWIGDYITFDLNTSGTIPGTSTRNALDQVVFTNTDEATLAGGEVYTEIDLFDWLTTFGNATYVEGRDVTHLDLRRPPNIASSRRTGPDTEPLPGIPPLEGRLGLRIHEARKNPKWSVELSVRMVKDQDLVAASLDEVPTPGFAIWDLRAYWQVNKHWLLTAGVENIGDKFYREALDPRAGFPTDQMFRPGTNLYFGTQVEY